MLSETKYNPAQPLMFTIIDPHGADSSLFWKTYPDLRRHPEVQKKIDLLDTYLAIERDIGATSLAHSLGQEIARMSGLGVEVLSIDYPRGFLDGGRDEKFAIREALPSDLLEKYGPEWKALHLNTVKRIEKKILHSDQNSLVIDVHTMSKYEYLRMLDGRIISDTVHWQSLDDYVRAFTEAHEITRPFNILCRDESNQFTSCPELVARLKDRLSAEKVFFEEDVPYRIMKRYRSHAYLNIRRGIAIDLPKNFVCKDQDPYQLENLEVDQEKVEYWGKVLAQAFL